MTISAYLTGPFRLENSAGIDVTPPSSKNCGLLLLLLTAPSGVRERAWLQDKLRAIGLRPISFLVDVTNYFTFDRARPLHVFDADKIAGNALRVYRAEGGETITGLDEKEYVFEPGMVIIADDNGAESIAGVMGGDPTGCQPETVNVFIESAYWDPVTTAATGRKLKIPSDARYRFERGIDPASCVPGIDMATDMILDL